MKSIFTDLQAQTDSWASLPLGTVNGVPVTARVMEDIEAEFHIHKATDEFFLVLSGTIFIDTENESIELQKGQSHTVKSGISHRARAVGRAELVVVGGHNA